MITKELYNAPCAEVIVLHTEQTIASSFDTTDRTEKMLWDEDVIDL